MIDYNTNYCCFIFVRFSDTIYKGNIFSPRKNIHEDVEPSVEKENKKTKKETNKESEDTSVELDIDKGERETVKSPAQKKFEDNLLNFITAKTTSLGVVERKEFSDLFEGEVNQFQMSRNF